MTDNATPKPPDSSFQTRVKSAVVLAPVVLILLYMGGRGFSFMIAAAGAIAAYEWAKMVMTGQTVPKNLLPLVASIAGFGVIAAAMVGNPLGALVFLMALLFAVFAYNSSQSGPSLTKTFLGIIYIGFACQIMIWLRNFTDHGLFNMLTLLFIVWASDIFAYFSGKSIGGPKLAPSISPKKTWAGLIGGSFGAGVVAALMAMPWVLDASGSETLGDIGMIGYFILGFVLSVVGQAGDLLISIFKRHYGVKDTGTIIPGHGGILDRIDALLLVAIVFGAFARIMGAS